MERKGIGVYKLDNGCWEYRYKTVVNGKPVVKKKRRDENGQKIKSKREAERLRKRAIEESKKPLPSEEPIIRKTVAEVFQEYCEFGRSAKAYMTIKKQDSLWKNHLAERYGNRWVDDISVAEVNDYLACLYYDEGRAFGYVESFLKMFYLIFGQAYDRNYLSRDDYDKLCLNKLSKIKMPKKKVSEEDDIKIFSEEEIKILDAYFKGTNAETSYALGKNCGLRINETYGLKWENVNLEEGTIYIDRQMQYQNGLIKLVSPKTRNAKRTIYLNEEMKTLLAAVRQQHNIEAEERSAIRMQNQTFIEDIDGRLISSTELVNCLLNGKIQTNNSMKYHSFLIKKRFGINFKYHFLRHTYGTRLAELNTPMHILCNQMGHASGKVTQQYYLGQSKSGIEVLKANLEHLLTSFNILKKEERSFLLLSISLHIFTHL